ncbi:MAG: helix-turn-helix domain-containing protein [Deltaproteobacteria bacterium]|nr:helix-turn-helix domain-containing protein [Deltaproteobacteria bacterium]
MIERRRGLSRGRGGDEDEILRPFQECPDAALNLARQEKSLEALGRMLKTKREINGLTRRDMVIKIKVPMDQLESIEDGRLSTLPPVFAKGFLRAYANELGLDAEAILDDYRKMTGGYKNEPASRDGLFSPYTETKIDSSAGGWWTGRRSMAAVLFLLFLGLAVLLWPRAWRTTADHGPLSVPEDSPPETALWQPEAETEPLLAPPDEPAAYSPEVAMASGSLSESDPLEDEEEFLTEAQGGELILVSQKDGVWLQLMVDGRPAKHYWLRQGQTVVQEAESVVVVRTGQAPALTASWNGRDLGALSSQPVAEARFPK